MINANYRPGGNPKLGKHIATISRPAHHTCPGASEWCRQACYATKRNYKKFRIQDRLLKATLTLPAKLPPVVRIHVSGDFDTVDYIRYWHSQARQYPDTTFYAYTRSWRVPELLPALEALRSLPNVQLFASTDSTIPEPTPPTWRVAYISGDTRYRGMICLEQTGKMPDCATCGYCFRKTAGNVAFLEH